MERGFARGFPLFGKPAWLAVLHALCAVAEGAYVPEPAPAAVSEEAACVAAVLGDPLRRLSIMGGRDGMPRSLGSVLGSLVVRFVGGFRARELRVIQTPGVKSFCNGIAVSRDGSTLLVSDVDSHGVHVFGVADGVYLRTIGSWGSGRLQFNIPRQAWVASDDFVFVAELGNKRIQILTPRDFDFHGFVGMGQLQRPNGVCADGDIIAVSELDLFHIKVFRRGDGALLRRIGSIRSGDGTLWSPSALCFMSGHSRMAVTDVANRRICVLSLEGEILCTVGVDKLSWPRGVACSGSGDELVVADGVNGGVKVFSSSGELLYEMERGTTFQGVTVHGASILAHTFCNESKWVVFT
jgi:hypothetical protein